MADSSELFGSRAPANKQTAKTIGTKGYSWEASGRNRTQLMWQSCPPLKRITADVRGVDGFVDFTNQRFGRLTVLGLFKGGSGLGARWVVRCDCGMFETRRAKALRHATDGQNAWCGNCDKLVHLKRADRARTLGYWEESGHKYKDGGSELKFAPLPELKQDKP